LSLFVFEHQRVIFSLSSRSTFFPDKDFSELHLWISWQKKQEVQMMHPENFLVRRQN